MFYTWHSYVGNSVERLRVPDYVGSTSILPDTVAPWQQTNSHLLIGNELYSYRLQLNKVRRRDVYS